MKDKIYIVSGSEGIYDEYFEYSIFATFDKEKAEKYVEKYNRILDKARDFYTPVNDIEMNHHQFDRYLLVEDTNHATIEELEVR